MISKPSLDKTCLAVPNWIKSSSRINILFFIPASVWRGCAIFIQQPGQLWRLLASENDTWKQWVRKASFRRCRMSATIQSLNLSRRSDYVSRSNWLSIRKKWVRLTPRLSAALVLLLFDFLSAFWIYHRRKSFSASSRGMPYLIL